MKVSKVAQKWEYAEYIFILLTFLEYGFFICMILQFRGLRAPLNLHPLRNMYFPCTAFQGKKYRV